MHVGIVRDVKAVVLPEVFDVGDLSPKSSHLYRTLTVAGFA